LGEDALTWQEKQEQCGEDYVSKGLRQSGCVAFTAHSKTLHNYAMVFALLGR
jgi:hypothetical protein